MPSSEKVQKHKIELLQDGVYMCKTCALSCPSPLCPSINVLLSRPCTKKANTQKIQILWTNDWLQEIAFLAKNMDISEWQIHAHSGKKIRFGDNAKLSSIPEPHEFPLLLEPIPKEELAIELERLQLEEGMLQEQLRLLKALVDDAIAKAPPGCPLAGSVGYRLQVFNLFWGFWYSIPLLCCHHSILGFSDALQTLPYEATLTMEGLEIPVEVPWGYKSVYFISTYLTVNLSIRYICTFIHGNVILTLPLSSHVCAQEPLPRCVAQRLRLRPWRSTAKIPPKCLERRTVVHWNQIEHQWDQGSLKSIQHCFV